VLAQGDGGSRYVRIGRPPERGDEKVKKGLGSTDRRKEEHIPTSGKCVFDRGGSTWEGEGLEFDIQTQEGGKRE